MLKIMILLKKLHPIIKLAVVFFTLAFAITGVADEPSQQSATQANVEQQRSVKLTSRKVEVAGRELHFVEVFKNRDQGPKPLVIFVHGTPGAWYNHASFLSNKYLQEHFHMISIDRLGHGASVGKVEPSLKAQAASLKPLLELDTTGKGAILIGHSLGGPIIARAAMDFQNQISRLMFIASSGDPKRSLRWYNTVGGFLPISWFVPRDLRRANKEILPLKKQLKAMLPLWQEITVPVTIIQGDKDKLVNPKNAEFIEKSLVNAEVTTLIAPNGDHFLHWRDPRIVIDVLAGYINN